MRHLLVNTLLSFALLKLIYTKLLRVQARGLKVKGLAAHLYSTEAVVQQLTLHLGERSLCIWKNELR